MPERPIDLEAFVAGCRGRSLQEFVWHHQEKSHAPIRLQMRAAHEAEVPPAALGAARTLADRMRSEAGFIDRDCGAVAEEFFRDVRGLSPTIEAGYLLDAFTHAALLQAEQTRIRGANYLPIYGALLVGGIALATLAEATPLVISGWILAGFGGYSILGSVGKPR